MKDFEEIAQALYDIRITSGSISKEMLLKKYGEEIEGFKEVLKFIYDPYFTTGIGKKKLNNFNTRVIGACPLDEIMSYLIANSTGDSFDVAMAFRFIYQSDDEVWQWAAEGLVTKDLQIGVSLTTLNKVYGKTFIPKIGIMRGMHCPENAVGIYIATEKIDGNRRLLFNAEDGPRIYTRSGKRDYGLVDIEAQLKLLPKGYVYDSECIAIGDWSDSIECRQASASILNSGGKKTGVKALIFDMLPIAEYDEGQSKYGALGRKAMIAGLFRQEESFAKLMEYFNKFDDMHNNTTHLANSVSALYCLFNRVETPNIMGLPILGIVHNKPQATKLAEPIWETGGEGIMLVEYRSPYEVNPNPRKTLLKIKALQEFTCKCVGVYLGEPGKKYEHTLGGIYFEYRATDGNIYKVGCGSGFPDYLRHSYWDHPEYIVGKMVELESFGESRNAQGEYSLNCPIFKRIAGEKE
jgi:DNA ligase 1